MGIEANINNTGSGAGNVTGPGSSVAGNAAIFADTSGTLLSDSGAAISNYVTGVSISGGSGPTTLRVVGGGTYAINQGVQTVDSPTFAGLTVGSSVFVNANQLSVYAAGTAYSLTNTAALLDFGTTDPSLTLTAAGTYLITGRCRLDYNAATFAASQTTTIKLRRTNNTPADLNNGAVSAKTAVITLLSYTFVDQTWQVIYTTANTNDIIQLFGSVGTAPGAGSLDAVEASIVAFRLQQ